MVEFVGFWRKPVDKPTHYRRCHICGGITEIQEGKVEKCDHCHRSLAPFYYFDDRFTMTFSDVTVRPQLGDGEYAPIQGLTVFWEVY